VIRQHGWIASYSSSRVREPVVPYYQLAPKDVTIRIVQGQTFTPEGRQAAVTLIGEMMERGALIHPPTTSFPFSATADAHAALESGSVIGKIVVEGPSGAGV
jgi:NADPH:quinone reductase-like Zn-dependent oxidoreductase